MRRLTAYWNESTVLEKCSMGVIVLWMFTALFEPWIATEGGIISFNYGDILGMPNSGLPPLSKTEKGIHWLGTDNLGRDVAAAMVHGARVSFFIGTTSVLISLLIGLGVGMFMGYFGDKKLKANFLQIIQVSGSVFFMMYYIFDIVSYGFSVVSLLMILVLTLSMVLSKYLSKLSLKRYSIPLDILLQRIFEVKESVPSLFLILAISAVVTRPSIWTLSFTIVFLQWVTFARFARVEMQKIVTEDYFLAARAQGLGTWRLFTKHAFPNLIASILTVIAFSMSGVILIESALSFLGVGLPVAEVTWGKLLAEARKHTSSWWLAVFPGLAIFALLYAFNALANMYRRLYK